jgi:hypothetical protein
MNTELKHFQVYTRILDSDYRPVSYWTYEPQILSGSQKAAIDDWVKLQERVYTVHKWELKNRTIFELIYSTVELGMLVELSVKEGTL